MRLAVVGPQESRWYLAAEGARGVVSPESVIEVCRQVGERYKVHVVSLNADVVAGFTHLAIAAEHAVRAWDRGVRISKYLEVEFLLYIVGSREIKKALKMCKPQSGAIVIAALGKKERSAREAVSEVIKHLGLSRESAILELTPVGALRAAEALGISPEVVKAANRGDVARTVALLAANRAVLLALS